MCRIVVAYFLYFLDYNLDNEGICYRQEQDFFFLLSAQTVPGAHWHPFNEHHSLPSCVEFKPPLPHIPFYLSLRRNIQFLNLFMG